ncbi:MAG: GNAT family N-acetyltransferase [Ruminococcus sp.]|nr:GNAT family N-acetyltransferase [Ruminococcus sp.]
MNYIIREIKDNDFQQLMELYTHLHEKDIPEKDERVSAVWENIISDKNHHIIVAEYEGKIISSCVCVIIPNLTRNQRPYAFVENVVTHADYRGNGIATACLDYARDIAIKENCYKLMLLTGSKNENTLNFYRRAGYNSEDKTAFIQWLE